MKYHLKDAAMHAIMNSLYDNFEERLNASCDWQMADDTSYVCVDLLYRFDIVSDLVHFKKEEIACEGAFDPTKWNQFPDVAPPIGVPMRVETEDGYGTRAIYAAGKWRDDAANTEEEFGKVKRFRPWE